MKTKAIMFQGVGSNVGKSVLTAAICRIIFQDGKKIAPFKTQNNTLNSYITREGYEIGRVQAMQAEAAGVMPTQDMNPILLKPINENILQVIIQGKIVGNFTKEEYKKFKTKLGMQPILQSYKRLCKNFSYIVIEGGGSPAEINFRSSDLVNMKTAAMAGAPVILVGDIDRGGVFASFIGTMEILGEKEKNKIAGFIINKFRGDKSDLKPAIKFLEQRTGKPVVGIIPYIYDIGLDEENSINEMKTSLHFSQNHEHSKLCIDVLYLPHISNFIDFDPFEKERGVHVRYVTRKRFFGKPDVLIIPDTKNIISDLNHLHERDYKEKILELYHNGVVIVGVGTGYYMLGKEIIISSNLKSKRIEGLGLLPFSVKINNEKISQPIIGQSINIPFYNGEIKGQGIHMDEVSMDNNAQHIFSLNFNEKKEDGVSNENFSVWGTSLYGIFHNDKFRKDFINYAKLRKDIPHIDCTSITKIEKEKKFNQLAYIVRNNLNMKIIYKLLENLEYR
ncbi:cobyric acid synthase [Candidatus Poribacteria bacterium]|nr:cobyric acid synthase [Candidatus Poribacteria bacterium]